jgi:hypothetical protein
MMVSAHELNMPKAARSRGGASANPFRMGCTVENLLQAGLGEGQRRTMRDPMTPG